MDKRTLDFQVLRQSQRSYLVSEWKVQILVQDKAAGIFRPQA
jgi:hypothetical protein